MKLAQIIGTVTATAKDPQLTAKPLLLANVVDGAGKVVEPAVVGVDTVGAGVGDTVLLTQGSAARLPAGTASAPIDTTIIAIVEHVTIAKP